MRKLLAASALCIPLFAEAQNQFSQYEGWRLGLLPLALPDVDNTFYISAEHRWKKLSVALDAGYIFGTYYVQYSRAASGMNLRPSARQYFGKRQTDYIQLQLFYKMVNYQMHDWLDKNVNNDVPAFIQLQDFIYRKTVTGASLMIGEAMPAGRRFFIDIYAGLGVRYKRHDIAGEPRSRYNNNPEDLLYRRRAVTISIPAGVRISFLLNKP